MRGGGNNEASAWRGRGYVNKATSMKGGALISQDLLGKVGMECNCGIVNHAEKKDKDAAAARDCGYGSVERGEEGDAMWRRCWQ